MTWNLIRRLCRVGTIAMLALISQVTLAAAPELWPKWGASDESSSTVVDHGQWSTLLAKLVVGQAGKANRFDYAAANDEDRRLLASYLQGLARVDIAALNSNEQKAFWLNLHNAMTVRTVLDNYPVTSVREIGASESGHDVWAEKRFALAGELLSLDDIYHRILRPRWPDPMIHYGVSRAAVGSPPLMSEAFNGEQVDQQLEANARAFINTTGVVANSRGLTASRLYREYAEDFGSTEGALLAHIRKLSEPKLQAAINELRGIGRYRSDWRLNAASPAD